MWFIHFFGALSTRIDPSWACFSSRWRSKRGQNSLCVSNLNIFKHVVKIPLDVNVCEVRLVFVEVDVFLSDRTSCGRADDDNAGDRRRQWRQEEVLLPCLWPRLLQGLCPEEPPEDPLRRTTVPVQHLWEELHAARSPEGAHENPHGREAVHVRRLRPQLHLL